MRWHLASTFLTPVTLWKDFDDTLPLETELLSERKEEGAVCREICFLGRKVGTERVKIYAQYFLPAGEEHFPVVLVLFEAGCPFDAAFVRRFTSRGYGVLCVDYCGENGSAEHTVYPAAIDYANYVRAGSHLESASPSARETSWYEWACVARYAAKFLSSRPEVTRFGAVGLRTGGEVLFKIAPYAPLSCLISVCAAGWLAYRGMAKFSEGEKKVFDEDHHRFIAGIDSQSYAPYVKCPVLLLSAVNDKKHDYDRVYDTFQLLPESTEKAFLYSSHGNGLIGMHSLADLDLFLDKYLKARSVFVSDPIAFSVEEEDGRLVARAQFDEEGELHEYGIFYTERITGSHARDWTRVMGVPANLKGNVGTFPLDLYEKSDRALVYAFANYSNNFSVTSKIQEVVVRKPYQNVCVKSRIVYSSERDGLNGISGFRRRARSVADCFADGKGVDAKLLAGYGGILGATAEAGVVSYRVNEPRYAAPEGASLRLDAYCAEDATLKITFYFDEDEENGYSAEVRVTGGGKWKSILLDPADFKSSTGAHPETFAGALSLVFVGSAQVLINNVLWI